MSSISKSGRRCQPLEDTCPSSESNNRQNPALPNPVISSSSSSDHNCDGSTSKSSNLKRTENEAFGDDHFSGEKCKKLRERPGSYLQMWINTNKYDVTFEVGSKKEIIPAHRIILAARCRFFDELFYAKITDSQEKPLKFPELDPVAFKKCQQYIYSDTITISGSTTKEIFDILQASSLFGLADLGTICRTSLRLQINSDNVVEKFHLAQERNDKRLEGLTRNHISSHIKDVFLSPHFLELSEDALCSLLNLDEWHLTEVEVLEHVKRWAATKDGGVNSGEQMRASMGKAFFGIRFPLMSEDEFYDQVIDKHPGLFRGKEIKELIKYYDTSDENYLQHFVSRVRLHQALTPLSTASVEDASSKTDSSDSSMEDNDKELLDYLSSVSIIHEESTAGVEETSSKPDHSDSRMEVDNKQRSGTDLHNNVSRSSVSIIHEDEDPEPVTQPPPPKKKSRIENARQVGTNNSTECTTVQKYVNALEKRNDKENIKVIDETLRLYALPRNSVHLPSLSEFMLRLKLNKSFKCGSEFIDYVDKKTAGLDQLLFFDKAPPNVSQFSRNSENNLKILLGQRVNISIHFEDCLILKVDHDEGELVMNMLCRAQEVINSLPGFPLRKLAMNHCELSSLKGLRQDLLETVVINGVDGLEHIVTFLDTCPSLREIACDSSASEIEGNLFALQRLLSRKEHLEKVSLAKGTLSFLANPRYRGRHSLMRELYLSNCSYELGSFGSYPNLKSVYLTDGKAEPSLFCEIMKIESLEWIFVERMTLNKTEKNVLSEEARVVHNFLSKVFNSDTKVASAWRGFILEKKDYQSEVRREMSKSIFFAPPKYDPFDASKWKGETVIDKNMYTNKLDYKHFSYNLFYPDYGTYARIELEDNAGE